MRRTAALALNAAGALILLATTSGAASAQGVPDWAPRPTFDVVRDHSDIGVRPWLHPYALDVLAPIAGANGISGPDDTVALHCSYAGGATFSNVDGRANYSCDDGRWLMGDPVAGPKMLIVIVPAPTIEQVAHPETLQESLAIITHVTIAVEQ